MDTRSVHKTFEIIFSRGIDFSMDDTYDSIEILSGQTKPSYDEFEKVHENVIRFIIPFEDLRRERNSFLAGTDWTQTNDIRLENDEDWVAYRQALRDLPANTEDPTHPEWPEPPQVNIIPGKTHLDDTRADLEQTRANLEATNAKLRDLETTNAKLQDLETTRTQLRDTQTELEVTKLKLANVEARLKILEVTISS